MEEQAQEATRLRPVVKENTKSARPGVEDFRRRQGSDELIMRPTASARKQQCGHSNFHQVPGAARCQVGQVCGLLLAIVLVSWAAAWPGAVEAEHALSEVWSESEGLQMKYSTDHDDLLSTKGSELSLQTHGEPKDGAAAAESQEAGGGQSGSPGGSPEGSAQVSLEESSPPSAKDISANEPPSSPESDSSGSSSSSDEDGDRPVSGEQGADSTSRLTDKVPAVGSHLRQAFSSAPSKQQLFREPAERFRAAPRGRPSQPEQSVPEAGSGDELQEGPRDETVSVDHGSDSGSPNEQDADGPLREQPGAKFRPPGRLYKEAVRHNSPPPPAAKTDSESNSDEQSSTDAGRPDEAEAPSSPVGLGEPEFPSMSGGGDDKPASSFKARQKMIDFDRLVVDNKHRVSSSAGSSPSGVGRVGGVSGERPVSATPTSVMNEDGEPNDEVANLVNDDDRPEGFQSDDDGPKSSRFSHRNALRSPQRDELAYLHTHQAPNTFYDQSGQRTLAAGSSPAHKERTAPNQQAASAKAPQQQQSAVPKLAYFRGLSQQQQADNGNGRARASLAPPVRHSAAPQSEEPASPDSVRDNFISPGHYPGSMPHLTQAASEAQKKELELVPATGGQLANLLTAPPGDAGSRPLAAAETRTSASSAAAPPAEPMAVSGSANIESSQPQPQQEKLETATTTASAARASGELKVEAAFDAAATLIAAAGDTTKQPEQQAQLQVTPEPEAQPESQQIMAPILLSTTTMAPMPAGAAATSESPNSLKRFRFRKYR